MTELSTCIGRAHMYLQGDLLCSHQDWSKPPHANLFSSERNCKENEKKYEKLLKNNSQQTAAWLAQLLGRQSGVREVEGSSPRPDQHSGS